MNTKTKQDLTVALVVYAFLLFIFVETNALPEAVSMFPRIIIIAFALLNTIMVITAFQKGSGEAVTLTEVKAPILYFIGIAGYVVLFRFLGYFPATAMMLVGFMLAFRVRPWWKIAIIVVGYTTALYVFFVVWLGTRLV